VSPAHAKQENERAPGLGASRCGGWQQQKQGGNLDQPPAAHDGIDESGEERETAQPHRFHGPSLPRIGDFLDMLAVDGQAR